MSTPTEAREAFTCDKCGHTWLAGEHGGHDCKGRMKRQKDAIYDALSALLNSKGITFFWDAISSADPDATDDEDARFMQTVEAARRALQTANA